MNYSGLCHSYDGKTVWRVLMASAKVETQGSQNQISHG
jgi:hypothetical protein